jgi:tRNA dimethylallyltransferase
MIDLVIVCGPTAAGKTALGAALAERFGGEVVSADAFAVYRGLDIGTAKPDRAMRARIPHHLIDIADPQERYSAGVFVRDADAAISEVYRRGRLPVVVGGTHFYVRALLHGLFPEPAKDVELRAHLEAGWRERPEKLVEQLRQLDPVSAIRIAPADRQRILRALEVCLVSGRPMSELWRASPGRAPRYRAVVIGVNPPRALLHARISSRVEAMFAGGLLDEIAGLLSSGLSADAHAFKAIGYREGCHVLGGRMTVAEARETTEQSTRQLAKRQLTWLRGEEGVEWLADVGERVVEVAAGIVEGRRGTGSGSS